MTPAEERELYVLAQRLLSDWASKRMGCLGKSRFDSHGAATATLNHRARELCNVYRCRHCGGWHVGQVVHSRRREKAERRILSFRKEEVA